MFNRSSNLWRELIAAHLKISADNIVQIHRDEYYANAKKNSGKNIIEVTKDNLKNIDNIDELVFTYKI